MSQSRTVDYEAVLADLRARRERIDAAIRAIEAVVAPGKPEPPPREQPAPGDRAERAVAHRGMSLLDASKKVLLSKGECQRTRDILRALQEEGIALTGKSPINTIGAVLNSSLKRDGGIVRVKRGVWSLASWQAQADGWGGDGVRVNGASRSVPMPPLPGATAPAAHA